MRTAIVLPLIMVLAGAAQPTGLLFRKPAPITGVSVRDAHFQVVKVLAPTEITAFRQHWQGKQKVEASLSEIGGQHFKIDIRHQGSQRGGRWLYRTTGYVWLLDKFATPVYKVQDPKAFNRLIGAEK